MTLKPAARGARVSITLGEGTKLESDERKRAGALRRLDFNVGLSVADAAGHSTQLHLHFVKRAR
jgi:PIN domain nuclease of toxin-antitoxin system